MSDELRRKLANPDLKFFERFLITVVLELDYWEDRSAKPNLPRSEFLKLYRYVPPGLVPHMRPRKSEGGPHGLKGEDLCFDFEFDFKCFGKKQTYYVKGYFFDKGDCRGVTIQSFRLIKNVVQFARNGK